MDPPILQGYSNTETCHMHQSEEDHNVCAELRPFQQQLPVMQFQTEKDYHMEQNQDSTYELAQNNSNKIPPDTEIRDASLYYVSKHHNMTFQTRPEVSISLISNKEHLAAKNEKEGLVNQSLEREELSGLVSRETIAFLSAREGSNIILTEDRSVPMAIDHQAKKDNYFSSLKEGFTGTCSTREHLGIQDPRDLIDSHDVYMSPSKETTCISLPINISRESNSMGERWISSLQNVDEYVLGQNLGTWSHKSITPEKNSAGSEHWHKLSEEERLAETQNYLSDLEKTAFQMSMSKCGVHESTELSMSNINATTSVLAPSVEDNTSSANRNNSSNVFILQRDIGNFSQGQKQVGEPDLSYLGQADDGCFKSATKDYTEETLPAELMSKMFGLLKEGVFCDAAILAAGKVIRIHKMVLIAASPFLLSKMSTTTPGTSLRVELPTGIQLQVASQLVHYLYDGKVTLTTDNVAQFARVAKLFRLEHLHKICEDFIHCFQLSPDLLNVQEEEINIFCTQANEHKMESPGKGSEIELENPVDISTKSSMHEHIKPIGKKKMMTLKDKEKSPANNKQVEANNSNSAEKMKNETSKCSPVTHTYGTRSASNAKQIMAKGTSKESQLQGEATPEKKPKLSGSFEKSSMKTGKKVTDWPKLLASISSSDTCSTTEPAEKDSSHVILNSSNSSIPNLDLPLDFSASLLEDDLAGSDFDDYELFHGKTKTKYSMTASVRKSALLKKSKRLQHRLNKKPQTSSLEKTSQTLRQPPKKRAREFTEKDIDEKFPSSLDGLDSAAVGNTQTLEIEEEMPCKQKKEVISPNVVLTKTLISKYCAALEERYPEIPENERQYICNLCGNEFVFPKRLIKHVILNHKIEPEEAVDSVMIRKYEKNSKVCDICNYENKESNFYYMHYHKYFRHGVPLPQGWKPWKCDLCGKEVFTKFQLKDHMLVHTESTPFICEQCGQVFQMRTSLNSHVFHKHSNVRKHQCDQCNKSFKTRTQLSVHMRSHTGEKPFACYDKECDYRSTTRGNMRLHLNNKHRYNIDLINEYMSVLRKSEYVPKPKKVFTKLENQVSSNTSTDHTTTSEILSEREITVSKPPNSSATPTKNPDIAVSSSKKKPKKKQAGSKAKNKKRPKSPQEKKVVDLKNAPESKVGIGIGNVLLNTDEPGVMYMTGMTGQPMIIQSVNQSPVTQFQQQQQQLNVMSVTPLNLAQIPANTAILQTDALTNQHFVFQNPTEMTTVLTSGNGSAVLKNESNVQSFEQRTNETNATDIDYKQKKSLSLIPAILNKSNGQLIVLNRSSPSVPKFCIDKHPGVEIHIPMEPKITTSSTAYENQGIGLPSKNSFIVHSVSPLTTPIQQVSSSLQTSALTTQNENTVTSASVQVSQQPFGMHVVYRGNELL